MPLNVLNIGTSNSFLLNVECMHFVSLPGTYQWTHILIRSQINFLKFISILIFLEQAGDWLLCW